MKKLTLVVAALSLGFGCTVSESKPINDIDASLWAKICKKATADAAAATTITCDDGTTRDVPAGATAAQCEASAATYTETCTATFGDWKTCAEWDPDYCAANPIADMPAACTTLGACVGMGEM